MSTPKKPKPVRHAPAYIWGDVEEYINEKYKCNIRDFAGKFFGPKANIDNPYQDFWHWLYINGGIHNGCYFYIDLDLKNYVADLKPWVKKILKMLAKEFPSKDKTLYCWVDW